MSDVTKMIKNDRQYRITKSQADKFEKALSELELPNTDLHPIQRKAYIEALASQLEELKFQVAEYEALLSGETTVLQLHSFDEISDALIKARIASGMSQKELAEKLGLKEQQIQRYEATGYRTASIDRVSEIVKVLGISVKEDFFLSTAEVSSRKLFDQLVHSGIDDQLVIKRILPTELVEKLGEGKGETEETKSFALKAASLISKIFNWDLADLFGNDKLTLSTSVSGTTRFKVTGRADTKFLNFYTLYAHYLANLVLKASIHLDAKTISTDALAVRQDIIDRYGHIDFANAVRYMWDMGIPVLPLDDPGAFNGACWREKGRNVIVLKQRTDSLSRWLFDLLHEARHTSQNPDQETFTIIETEETSPERRESEEEQEASQFSGDVLLNGRSEELVKLCLQRAGRQIPRLKSIVSTVAQEENVAVADLANYMAFRLSIGGDNWWATANNLQEKGNPVEIARNILFEKINFSHLTSSEKELLMRALSSL